MSACRVSEASRCSEASVTAGDAGEYTEPVIGGAEEADHSQRAVVPGIGRRQVVEDLGPLRVPEQVGCVREADDHRPPLKVVIRSCY
jgi:hypothetical protein